MLVLDSQHERSGLGVGSILAGKAQVKKMHDNFV